MSQKLRFRIYRRKHPTDPFFGIIFEPLNPSAIWKAKFQECLGDPYRGPWKKCYRSDTWQPNENALPRIVLIHITPLD